MTNITNVPNPLVPNPGSQAAVALGCTCPVMDNHYGMGIPSPDTGPLFWVVEGCPVHGIDSQQSGCFLYKKDADFAIVAPARRTTKAGGTTAETRRKLMVNAIKQMYPAKGYSICYADAETGSVGALPVEFWVIVTLLSEWLGQVTTTCDKIVGAVVCREQMTYPEIDWDNFLGYLPDDQLDYLPEEWCQIAKKSFEEYKESLKRGISSSV